jgi:phosphonate transport system substrate-binding protein
MFKKSLLGLIILMVLTALAACGGGGNESNEEQANSGGDTETEKVEKLTMGFIPSQEAGEIADTVEPLEEKLSEVLGVPVEAQVMIDFVGLVEGMRTGQIDIGFLNPFGYVQATERADVEVILKSIRRGADSYRAQFNVPADSKLNSIEDIVNSEGLAWAYSDTLSTSGFLFPASLLTDMGVENLQNKFQQTVVGGHDNAILAILDGQADFATTFEDARETVQGDYPDVMDKIKVIGYTDPIPNDTISVRAGLPDEMKEKIKQAFLSFNDDEAMIKVMNEVYTWDGIAEAKDEEYDIVRGVYSKFKDQLAQ